MFDAIWIRAHKVIFGRDWIRPERIDAAAVRVLFVYGELMDMVLLIRTDLFLKNRVADWRVKRALRRLLNRGIIMRTRIQCSGCPDYYALTHYGEIIARGLFGEPNVANTFDLLGYEKPNDIGEFLADTRQREEQ